MDKEKCTHAIKDQSQILHSRADFALRAGQDASMDALFVQTVEQSKSQVMGSVTAIAPSYRLWPAEENHQHLIGSVRSKWHRETGCMKGLSAACSVCTPQI